MGVSGECIDALVGELHEGLSTVMKSSVNAMVLLCVLVGVCSAMFACWYLRLGDKITLRGEFIVSIFVFEFVLTLGNICQIV